MAPNLQTAARWLGPNHVAGNLPDPPAVSQIDRIFHPARLMMAIRQIGRWGIVGLKEEERV